jgi:exodeoxyribonuclease V beta subunit
MSKYEYVQESIVIELNHLQVQLTGVHLIEASAGTGKTYAIALLYLRILVELQLEPKQILVVTYTEAATKELRGRIRKRIREALDLIDGKETTDKLLSDLCANANGRWADKTAVRSILDRALKSFDTASIFTIHAFCLRALKDNAFESGSRYDIELVTDQSELFHEIVDDFWRQTFFRDSVQLLKSVLAKFSPDSLYSFVKGMVGNPKQQIIPPFTVEQVSTLEAGCQSAFEAVKQTWTDKRQEIVELIKAAKGLSKGPYKADLLPPYFEQLDSFTANTGFSELPEDYSLFCSSSMVTTGKGVAPEHLFFEQCEALKRHVEQRLLMVKGALIAYCTTQLGIRKQQRNVRFFDDLLNNLFDALNGDTGLPLAAKLRTSYQAALIDEFQDTDPVQYDIFKTIYADTSAPLFLIGDPKQAIYSFRGADIFAYMQAAEDVKPQHRFTLTSNWRSTPDLLSAFNQLFSNQKKPFLYEQIEYHPVGAGQESARQLTSAAVDNAPFQVWLMPPADLNVTKANNVAVAAVAVEISRLLREGTTGKALIGDKPVMPGDIAVIVRSHWQAKSIRDALVPLGIPCVLRGDMTIFETDQAREVSVLLEALLNPASTSAVRAALLTDILGRSGSDLALLSTDEKQWDLCLEQFREYHQLWHDKGFMVMARLLLSREGIRGRLLGYPDGERRLTNLLHCLEVIHGKTHQRGIGMEGLVTWFTERVAGNDKADEHEIRLETDEQAVKIITIFVSKGLEYPIVFCPFIWGGIIENKEVISFHDDYAMVKDYGSDDFEANRSKAREELLAESLRLLYVAVTRAKYRCYLYAGKIDKGHSKSDPATSSLAYLIHASAETRAAKYDLVDQVAQEFLGFTAAELADHYTHLVTDSGGCISAAPLADVLEPEPWQSSPVDTSAFACRTFKGQIQHTWRVTSFTSFAAHEYKAAELPDRDETTKAELAGSQARQEPATGTSIFTFPKGAQAGIFMHELFEKIDFSNVSELSVNQMVEEKTGLHGIEKEWQPCLCEMVSNVLHAPLGSQDSSFTLADLKSGSWQTELEFFFPLKFISSDLLRRALGNHTAEYEAVDLDAVLAALQFKPVQGMVQGFMDMVFEHQGRYYLLDWKSNHLGLGVEQYGQEAMKREMERNLYPLQYLLYTVALNRYLALRVTGYDYTTHFGGVYYIFLRGVEATPTEECYGIYRDLPPCELVNALTDTLVAAGGQGGGL